MQLSRAEYIKLNIQTKGICVFFCYITLATLYHERTTKNTCASI